MRNKGKSANLHLKTSRHARLAVPSVIIFRLFLFVSILVFAILWFTGVILVSGPKWYGPISLEGRAQVRAIQRRLSSGEDKAMGKIFPEGQLFSRSFYGFCLVNMVLSEPEDSQFKTMAIEEIEKLLPKIDALVGEVPFEKCEDITPKGGIILAGHANLLRAGYIFIGGKDQEILGSFHKKSQILYDEFMKSSVSSLESYPGFIWPVDNICALESLRLHDVLFGTDYIKAGEQWVEWMSSNTDSDSGMMVAQISASGEVYDGPRGCALSWSLALMPGFAPDFASSQYALFRKNWFIQVGGITGIREWWPGQEGKMDCDTGPIIGGIGAAASGFGIAAAKVHGDAENFLKLLRSAELFGFPTWNVRREKNYFLGRVLLADILLLWGKTIRVWDRPLEIKTEPKASMQFGFWVIFSILTLICMFILYLLLTSLKKIYLEFKKSSKKLSKINIGFLVFQSSVVILWLMWSDFSWLYTTVLMGAAAIVENTFFHSKA